MVNENLISIFFKERKYIKIFDRLQRKHFVKTIKRNSSFEETYKLDKKLNDEGYLICGENENGDYIYIHYDRASERNKRLILEAHNKYLTSLGLIAKCN